MVLEVRRKWRPTSLPSRQPLRRRSVSNSSGDRCSNRLEANRRVEEMIRWRRRQNDCRFGVKGGFIVGWFREVLLTVYGETKACGRGVQVEGKSIELVDAGIWWSECNLLGDQRCVSEELSVTWCNHMLRLMGSCEMHVVVSVYALIQALMHLTMGVWLGWQTAVVSGMRRKRMRRSVRACVRACVVVKHWRNGV